MEDPSFQYRIAAAVMGDADLLRDAASLSALHASAEDATSSSEMAATSSGKAIMQVMDVRLDS